MPTPTPLSEPKRDDDVLKLWRHVASAIKKVNLIDRQISDLIARIPSRRRMDVDSAVASATQMFHIKSIHDDYLTCRTWDGTTEGETDIYVAKCYNCRKSYTHQIVDGVDYTFTYASDNQRTSSDGTNSQIEVVYPRYTTYAAPSAGYHPPGTIFAFKSLNNTGVQVSGVDVEWVEERRLWLRKYSQT